MRTRLALLPLLAALPLLSGCYWWSVGARSEGSASGSATVEAPALTDAEAAVLSVIPPIEAYYADNDTYAGLQDVGQIYGITLEDVRIFVRKNGRAYCVEAPVGAPSAHFESPQGPLSPGPC
jgi:hypothetical protein